MEHANFVAERLRVLLPRLEEKYHAAVTGEAREAYLVKYRPMAAEGEALADEFVEVYAECQARLVDLFHRLQDFNARASQLHLSCPANVSARLVDPERAVRGALPSLAGTVVLPPFAAASRNGRHGGRPPRLQLPSIRVIRRTGALSKSKRSRKPARSKEREARENEEAAIEAQRRSGAPVWWRPSEAAE